MPLAGDVTTGGDAPVKPSKLRPAPEPARPETAWSALGGGPTTATAHSNPPVRSVGGPERESALDELLLQQAAAKDAAFAAAVKTEAARLEDELGMKAGALTTVKEVEEGTTGTPAWDAAIAARMGEGYQGTSTPGMGSRAGSTIDASAIAAEREEDVVDQQERAKRTQRAALNLGGRRQDTKELTTEEYAKLSPRKKAAVDLNTLLVTAIREDLQGKKSADAGGKEYDAAVADMFGEKGAADARYAPQTMRVLQDIGFKMDGTQLDDILKLKVGLTSEDIRDIGAKNNGSADASLLTPEKRRDDLTEALVTSFARQRKDPQRGAALLETQRDVLNTREAFDFGSPANNQLVEQVYEFLANPENKGKAQQTMALAKQELSDEHWPMFLEFLDVRSREALQYDRPLGMDSEVEYMKPRPFRKRLGI